MLAAFVKGGLHWHRRCTSAVVIGVTDKQGARPPQKSGHFFARQTPKASKLRRPGWESLRARRCLCSGTPTPLWAATLHWRGEWRFVDRNTGKLLCGPVILKVDSGPGQMIANMTSISKRAKFWKQRLLILMGLPNATSVNGGFDGQGLDEQKKIGCRSSWSSPKWPHSSSFSPR